MANRRGPAAVAYTRAVSPDFPRCELTHLERVPIDLALARAQHAAYEDALRTLGCDVRRVEAAAGLPDAVFVEDTAVIFDELALITRPGAESRRGETAAIAAALGSHRPLRRIEAPGTLDGGDVLHVGRRVFIGRSSRSNDAGIAQARHILARHGYSVEAVAVRGCLHLKSAVTALADDRLLIHRPWTDGDAFDGLGLLDVDPAEPYGANALRLGRRLLYAAEFSRTRERLERAGFEVTTIKLAEIAKAEGAVTCCSLIVPHRPALESA